MPSGGASGPAPDETPAASAQSSIDEPTLDHAIVADGPDGPIATYAGDKSSANCSKVGLHLDEDEVADDWRPTQTTPIQPVEARTIVWASAVTISGLMRTALTHTYVRPSIPRSGAPAFDVVTFWDVGLDHRTAIAEDEVTQKAGPDEKAWQIRNWRPESNRIHNAHMPEPPVVVASREHLWWLLAEASMLEHMIMCQYLFAEFSLKSGAGDGLTPEQAASVERWRETIRGIAVEEMLHLALVSNLMAAIGAAPTFTRPNFPQRSGYFPSSIQLDLLPFGEKALRHFLFLERPEGMERQDAEGFEPVAPPRAPLARDEVMPRGQEFLTVGHLYRGIEDGMRGLAARLGERAVFIGSPRAQATPALFGGWPQVIAVTDLASAQKAVDEIIEQGEGARGDWRPAHYGRFLGIWEEYQALRQEDPSFDAARPVVRAYTRQPFDIAEPQILITDADTHRVAELAALSYEVVLQLLIRFFTHTDETDEQLRTLVDGAINVMTGVVQPLGRALATMPVGSEHPGQTAGFAFDMYYPMGNFVPWRESAWALLRERTVILNDRCSEVEAAGTASETVTLVRQRVAAIAATLTREVPAVTAGN